MESKNFELQQILERIKERNQHIQERPRIELERQNFYRSMEKLGVRVC